MATDKAMPEWAEEEFGPILDAAGLYGTWRNRGSYLLMLARKYGPDSREFETIYGRYTHDETIVRKLSEVGNL